MKIGGLIFILLSYSVAKTLIIASTTGVKPIEFPTIDVPDFEPRDVTAGCSAFVDCIEYVGAVIYNVALGVIFVIRFLIDLFVFVVRLGALVTQMAFTGVAGAPWWINTIIIAIPGSMIGVIVYKLVRSGKSND